MADQPEFTEEQIRQRRDAAIRRALSTPPLPRTKGKEPVRKGRARVAKSEKRGQAGAAS